MIRRGLMMIKPSPSIEYLQHPNIYVQRQVIIGKRLVILAESDSGELYNPTLIYDKDMAREFFGSGALIQAYEDACTYQEGINIFLMRIEPLGFETAFSVLQALAFDLLLLNDVSFNKDAEIVKKFMAFAKDKEEQGNLVHGIITLSSLGAYDSLIPLFPLIKDLTEEIGDDAIELGKYLSVVVNQMEFKNASAVYAGLLASVDPEISPINKTIPDVTLNLEFSKEEILKLREVGIVCFKQTFKKGVTCTSSSCAVSTSGSVHKHISNFRIAQFLINQISIELQPFIGMPSATHQAIRVEDIVSAICYEQISLQRIRDFDYYVSVDELNGYIIVEIDMVPIFSVHSMTTHSRVRIFK